MAVLVRRLGGIDKPELSDVLVDGSYWEAEENGTLLVFDAEGAPIAEYRQYKWDSAIKVVTPEELLAASLTALLLDVLEDAADQAYEAAEEAAYAEKAEREAYADLADSIKEEVIS